MFCQTKSQCLYFTNTQLSHRDLTNTQLSHGDLRYTQLSLTDVTYIHRYQTETSQIISCITETLKVHSCLTRTLQTRSFLRETLQTHSCPILTLQAPSCLSQTFQKHSCPTRHTDYKQRHSCLPDTSSPLVCGAVESHREVIKPSSSRSLHDAEKFCPRDSSHMLQSKCSAVCKDSSELKLYKIKYICWMAKHVKKTNRVGYFLIYCVPAYYTSSRCVAFL